MSERVEREVVAIEAHDDGDTHLRGHREITADGHLGALSPIEDAIAARIIFLPQKIEGRKAAFLLRTATA